MVIDSGEKKECGVAKVSWLGRLSIRNKLIVVLMLVSVTAVVVACAAFIGVSFVLHHQELKRDITSLAMVVGKNSMAALSFDMPEDAESILSGLSGDDTITYASILDSEGDVFASYKREGFAGEVFVPVTRESMVEDGVLYVFYDIMMNFC